MKWSVRLALAGVILALLLTAMGCGGNTDTGLTPGQRISAQEAWKVMEADVTKWKAGSMIIECRQPARRGKEDLGVDGLSSAWRFIVGPLGDGNQAYYTIDTTAEPIKPNRSDQVRPAAKAILDPATWTIDSPKAMEIALANGLQEFIDGHASFEVRMMTFEIDITVEQGAFWKIEAKDGSDVLALKISATDGSILP